MSGIPNTNMLSKLGRRRKLLAFLTVACATFFCLGMIWPLSIRSWRSESEIALVLSGRQNAEEEFQKVLSEVVKRHTSPDSIARVVQQHGLKVDGADVAPAKIADVLHERLNVVVIDDAFSPSHRTVRVGLNGGGFDGEATEKENFLVNMLATTIARDVMTSPLAGILPTEPIPTDDLESLQLRHAQIERQANQLLTQIQSNLQNSANELANSEGNMLVLDDGQNNNDPSMLQDQLEELKQQRQRIASADGESILELEAIDQQIDDVRGELANASQSGQRLFHMASHSNSSVNGSASVSGLIDSLHSTIGDLANVAAEACSAAETASRTRPAFTVMGVEGNAATPVGAIPNRKELMFLLLASAVFATIVSVAYKPFAQRGFESTEQVGKKLGLPVIATLQSRNSFEDITGPGIPVESRDAEVPGSNQVVNICKWILFCSLMLTIGFCLVNEDIRNAFFVSPFHGFAQIVWTLKGY